MQIPEALCDAGIGEIQYTELAQRMQGPAPAKCLKTKKAKILVAGLYDIRDRLFKIKLGGKTFGELATLLLIPLQAPDTVFCVVGGTISVRPGLVSSTLHANLDQEDPQDMLMDSALNGVESLLLALATAGVDVSTPQFMEAVETAVESISNNY